MKLSEIVLLENYGTMFSTESEVAEFLVKNCPDWKDYSKPLYRYSDNNPTEPTLKSSRVRQERSQGGTAVVQDFIFSLPGYEEYPDRAKSVFCSTNNRTEMGNEVNAIFPVGNVKMGQTNNKDFNYIQVMDKFGITGIENYIQTLCSLHDVEYKKNTISELVSKIRTAIKEDGVLTQVPESLKQLYFVIRNGKFESYFSPEKLGLNLVDVKSIKYLGDKQTEVWFEGKYLSMPEEWVMPAAKLANKMRAEK